MMRQYELLERVTRYNPKADEALLNKAYVYGMQKHGHQTRASGDPYFSHPLEVAAILTDMHLDEATIAVGLLHDTIEDTDATRAEIDDLFGEDIGTLVDGLTKIDRLDLTSREEKQAENLRKLLIAISQDVRVLLVKLADRLHNMRTLQSLPSHKRERIANETMEIYAPLAGRMGMREMREELEELAFKATNEEAHSAIVSRLDNLRTQNANIIEEVKHELSEHLEGKGVIAEVTGREKRPFSIFKKMQTKGLGFEQLSDIYGFRVQVNSIEDCYRVVGLIHTKWSIVPGRFKDFISTPKKNDYQSIHTTIIGPSRQRVELQIRTYEMHAIAEYGVAAHALYKNPVAGANNQSQEGAGAPPLAFNQDSQAYSWLRQTVNELTAMGEGDQSHDFLEHTKLELFQDQVFCFTPKGRIIALPRGANAIDFAYAVHTQIGDSCVGVKLNGRIMPLFEKLNNGDQVEILSSKVQTAPPRAWSSLVKTGKARACIRRALRAQQRERYIGYGRHILSHAFSEVHVEFDEAKLDAYSTEMGEQDANQLLYKIGNGTLNAEKVCDVLFPKKKRDTSTLNLPTSPREGWFEMAQKGLKFRIPGQTKTAKVPRLDPTLPVYFNPEGGAIPGDRIIGILTPDECVTVYPIQAQILEKFEDQSENWLDVRWDIEEGSTQRFPADILVSAVNEPGALADVTRIIANQESNIERIELTAQSSDFTNMRIALFVYDINTLNRLMSQIRTLDAVSDVTRVGA